MSTEARKTFGYIGDIDDVPTLRRIIFDRNKQMAEEMKLCDEWRERAEAAERLKDEHVRAFDQDVARKHWKERAEKAEAELLTLRKTLEQVLQDLESAAWQRSWSKLKKAREAVKAATGITLTGKLTAMLSGSEVKQP